MADQIIDNHAEDGIDLRQEGRLLVPFNGFHRLPLVVKTAHARSGHVHDRASCRHREVQETALNGSGAGRWGLAVATVLVLLVAARRPLGRAFVRLTGTTVRSERRRARK